MDAQVASKETAEGFHRSLRILIAATWAITPVFGLSFLVWVVEMFDLRQLEQIVLAPPLPLYLIGAFIGADVYFRRLSRPIVSYLKTPTKAGEAAALERARRFPFHFWLAFLVYLAVGPVAVLASAQMGYGFAPRPVDWFRIELVSLVISIIVGLPMFFLIVDLFGRSFRDATLSRPHVTMAAKVFLIATLVPLLIDTMLVQYYWTRTDYFSAETFLVWLVLELLAVAGALMFVRSFRQSLEPFVQAMSLDPQNPGENPELLRPKSTDELGVLAVGYRALLTGLESHNRSLALKNEMFQRLSKASTVADVMEIAIDVARRSVGADSAMIATHDAASDELVVVSHTQEGYRESGFLRLPAEALQVSHDAQPDASVRPNATEVLGHRVGVVAPLAVEDLRLGVLAAGFENPGQNPSPASMPLFADIAREASSRLHGVLQRERQSDLERQLQYAHRLDGIGRLAGGIAHDFNNILTAILGCASMLAADLRGPHAREDVEEIMASAERAAALTRQLLAFSCKQLLEPSVVEVNQLINNLFTMLKRLIPSSTDFSVDLGDPLWDIKADPGQIEQVILNLVINARDAVHAKGTIVVETRNVDDSVRGVPLGEWVRIRVIDDGTGIAPESLDRIFEPYFTTKDEGRGTGLGLATVYGVVSQSKGYVFVESTPKRGTTFTVLLPRATESPVSASPESSTEPIAAPTSCTVLLAEDNEQVRNLVSGILRRQSFTVIEATRGDEALEIASEYRGEIDLLVTDAVMPGCGGVELANRLREARPGLRVLLMSGYTDRFTVGAKDASDLPFVSKPFTVQVLLAKVLEVLARDPAEPSKQPHALAGQ